MVVLNCTPSPLGWQVLRRIQMEQPSASIPEGYLREFRRAEMVFSHQVIYNPISRQTEYLSPLPDCLPEELGVDPELDFLGRCVSRFQRKGLGSVEGGVSPLSAVVNMSATFLNQRLCFHVGNFPPLLLYRQLCALCLHATEAHGCY